MLTAHACDQENELEEMRSHFEQEVTAVNNAKYAHAALATTCLFESICICRYVLECEAKVKDAKHTQEVSNVHVPYLPLPVLVLLPRICNG